MSATIRKLKIVAIAALAFGAGSAANAVPIIFSVSGPNVDNDIGFSGSTGLYGATFTTSVDYTNVDFTIAMAAFFNGPQTVTVASFLTNQIGPGTTVANEIASASQTFNVAISPLFAPHTLTSLSILSLPSLTAGTYSIVYRGNNPGVFVAGAPDGDESVFTDVGVTVDSSLSGGIAAPYLPASSFVSSESNSWLTMTGDRVAVAQVPEPATLSLLGLGLLGIGLSRRKARRAVAA